ncbi:sensor histidine kinase [Candidatus Laterigemmans baculatus]|uniref:sensor histidine kinase n=1 Tax=Candidatus Laterigemmans baculatus TaxID=2770505 RepID=UPI0013DCD704|nr:ATP-binding protein [Candidatus Laterigemmans baculatus]
MSKPSELAEARQEIEMLRRQLRQSQQLATLGELTGTATHEFNNILMTVLNYAKMGLRHRDDATRDKALSKILDASQRAAKITSTILAQARNRSDDFVPTRIEQVVEDTLVLLERELRKYRVAVVKEFTECPPALANGNDIQRVLINLLVNARQAMRDGGTLRISLAPDAESRQVVLRVRDSGGGIAAEDLPKIFTPFYSSKAGPDETGKGGTGLGLAVCREIIEAHQGRIRVESAVGKGTMFIIRLPIAEPAKTEAAA